MGAERTTGSRRSRSYVRNSFGNTGSLITPADVARVAGDGRPQDAVDRAEIEASLPVLVPAEPAWKVTASHNAAAAAGALGAGGWTSGEPQQAGMWVQVEFPQPRRSPRCSSCLRREPAARGGGGGAGRGATPRAPFAYSVQVSMDGSTWSTPVAEGQDSGRRTVIPFKPVEAKFIRITQTATAASASPWVLQRLRLYQLPGRTQ